MERCAWSLAASFSIARKARALMSEFLHRRIIFVPRMRASLLLISAPAMENQNDFFTTRNSPTAWGSPSGALGSLARMAASSQGRRGRRDNGLEAEGEGALAKYISSKPVRQPAHASMPTWGERQLRAILLQLAWASGPGQPDPPVLDVRREYFWTRLRAPGTTAHRARARPVASVTSPRTGRP